MKSLSICIPVYNREEYIEETLDSIITQIDEEIESKVEICISDNSSTDSTGEICQKYLKEYSYINYKRNSENMGADKNYYNSINMANGNYCWLLGSDDTLEKDSLRHIISEINKKENISVFYLNNYDCDINLEKIRVRKQPVKDEFQDKIYTNAYECVKEIGAMFGYISALILKKSSWNEVNEKEKYIGSAYVHIHWIYDILKNNGKLKYISTPIVNWRSGNDSFLLEGVHKRTVIDIVAYNDISQDVFGLNCLESKAINIYVMKNYIVFRVYSVEGILRKFEFIKKLLPLLIKNYSYIPYFWYEFLPNLLIKTPLKRVLKKVIRLK